MPTLGWGSEIPKSDGGKEVKRILLVAEDPDSLSDAARAKIAQHFGRFEVVRIDPMGVKDHDKICRSQGDPPVLMVGSNHIIIPLDTLRRGVEHFVLYDPLDPECSLQKMVYRDERVYFESACS